LVTGLQALILSIVFALLILPLVQQWVKKDAMRLVELGKGDAVSVHVSKSYKRYYTGHLSAIRRCPRENCDGDLKFQVVGDKSTDWKKPCGGYEGMPQAMFRCEKCNLGFIITNPNSFWDDETIRKVEKGKEGRDGHLRGDR
jgi:hypothetical protein